MRYNAVAQRFKRLQVAELIITGSTGGRATIGTGDNVTAWTAGTAGQLLDIREGTAASPDTTQNPIVKVSRTVQMSSTGIDPSDGADFAAGIISVVSGTATNEVQTVGVVGYARSASTVAVPSGADDACGLYGVGRITGSGTGYGIGCFVQGRRDTDTGRALGLEIQCGNYTATAGTYNSTGASLTMGLWINAVGDSDSGAGIEFGGYRQFKVGIAFNGMTNLSAGIGGVADSSIRDDCTSAVSMDIRGTHATAAIRVAAGAGASVFPNAPGSFEIPTECYSMMSRRIQLTGTQRGTMAGTARLRIT